MKFIHMEERQEVITESIDLIRQWNCSILDGELPDDEYHRKRSLINHIKDVIHTYEGTSVTGRA